MGKDRAQRKHRHKHGDEKDGKKGTGSDGHAASAATADPVRVVEKGSFATAVCDCGWGGPGRRSRKRAREDAAEHLTSSAHRAGDARR